MPRKGSGLQAIIVPINGYSDGVVSHRPAQPPYAPCDPVLYLEKLAKKWMEESGRAEPGKVYVLDRLPAGYALFDKARSSGARDKYLFGHPTNQIFDSPNRFYPHFRFLMEHGQEGNCTCDACAAPAAPVPRSAAPAAARSSKGKGKMKAVEEGPVDEEGTPDVYATLMQELHRAGKLDVTITQVKSMDWRIEQAKLPRVMDKVLNQPSFIPRVGELVLWCRDIDGEIVFDSLTKEFKLGDINTQQSTGFPKWMCGVIAQVPDEEVQLGDLVTETEKQNAINVSGFRVECLPDPNDSDKGLSKQYSYIPLRQIRPLNFWQEILRGIPEDDLHPTIYHGLSVMASVCVIMPFRFKGTWPSCNVSCKGMFLGAELFYVGDTVRIMPDRGDPTLTDVLRIESIFIKWANLEFNADSIVNKDCAAYLNLHLVGHGYTLDEKRSYKGMILEPDDDTGRYPLGMEGYDRWYYMHRPESLLDCTFDRILGRCYEGNAMRLWSRQLVPTLSLGLQGVQAARLYSAENDQRIVDTGKIWFWGEHRAQCLDLGTLNGIEVGDRDPDRDPKLWREVLEVLDGETSHKDVHAKTPLSTAQKAPKSTFTPINSQSSLVASAMQQTSDSDGSISDNDLTKEKRERKQHGSDGDNEAGNDNEGVI